MTRMQTFPFDRRSHLACMAGIVWPRPAARPAPSAALPQAVKASRHRQAR